MINVLYRQIFDNPIAFKQHFYTTQYAKEFIDLFLTSAESRHLSIYAKTSRVHGIVIAIEPRASKGQAG